MKFCSTRELLSLCKLYSVVVGDGVRDGVRRAVLFGCLYSATLRHRRPTEKVSNRSMSVTLRSNSRLSCWRNANYVHSQRIHLRSCPKARKSRWRHRPASGRLRRSGKPATMRMSTSSHPARPFSQIRLPPSQPKVPPLPLGPCKSPRGCSYQPAFHL